MDTIRLTVNGQEIETTPDRTILELVRERDLDRIPTLCHSPELAPYGSCFLCVVEVKGRPNLVPSCATRVAPGMVVETRNERIVASRKTALELLLSNHYADCLSPCRLGCPAGVDVQGYLALTAMGLERQALDLIRETNPLPAICGRVCVRKCEVVCRRADVDAPVAINWVKRYLSDQPDAYAGVPTHAPPNGKSVGIVGAGPAGLTAAWFLGRLGYKPVIYEAMPQAGGMLRYGIPAYRLPDDVIDAEVAYIQKVGIEIRLGVRVGRDITLDELHSRHDALFLAAGAWAGKPMQVAGEFATEGVVSGAVFLQEKAATRSPVRGTVAVVGGGNTAMDVARTSWRLGADKVLLVYRRTRAEMPADPAEIQDCVEEGVEIMELVAPVGLVTAEGRLKALKCTRMVLGEPDRSGRRRPIPLEGSEFELPCDLAVAAIGQDPVLEGLTALGTDEVALTRWKTFRVESATLATSVPGVFAGGDAADDGPTVVIDAIADGGKAARAIHAWISGGTMPRDPFVVRKDAWAKPGKTELGEIPQSPRHELQVIDVDERRGSFCEVATGFDPEDALHECSRCLSCGCVRFDDCELRLLAEEYDVDPMHYAGTIRKHKVDDRHPYIVYDPNKCILCARCIRTCARVLPIAAIGLTGRGFRTEMRPAMDDPLVQTNCVSCGNCVDACPTGALTIKTPFPGRAALPCTEVTSSCGFCSLGCTVTVKRYGGPHVAVSGSGRPGDYLCRYGRFGHEIFTGSKRIASPTLRVAGGTVALTFEETFAKAVAGLRRAAAHFGPEAVAVFVSPELTNEELWIAGRIAREGLGTRNVGSLAVLQSGVESGALDAVLGYTASTADRSVLAEADVVVCNNTSLENDHLVLVVDVLEAIRRGARLVVANSTLDPADKVLASVGLDPMRGRAALVWRAVAAALIEAGAVPRAVVETIEDGPAFLAGLAEPVSDLADRAGVTEADIRRTAEVLALAHRVVFVHSPDRPQDQAPGDLVVLADLVVLLRNAGKRADLLLPGMMANLAGMEVTGADPAFAAGRVPAPDLPGARTRDALRRLLAEGRIRAALVVGEDPLRHERTAAPFREVEFLVAMDWTPTETTQAADVVLPGSTWLESEGTRCTFEGRVVRATRAVEPPSGRSGWQVLAGLADRLGVSLPGTADAVSAALDAVARAGLADLVPLCWNQGEARPEPGPGRLVLPPPVARPGAISPPLTHGERYKRDIREVGTSRYRVH
ncbi:MAG: FAD-dependent oxidoreductase [Deltaproteobacteria bacterium]|nr:FAD-dependent oxidoreductase [Deltaproteobacteria bacterium]